MVKKLANKLFHEYQNLSDIELKDHLKQKLDDNEYCTNKFKGYNNMIVVYPLISFGTINYIQP